MGRVKRLLKFFHPFCVEDVFSFGYYLRGVTGIADTSAAIRPCRNRMGSTTRQITRTIYSRIDFNGFQVICRQITGGIVTKYGFLAAAFL